MIARACIAWSIIAPRMQARADPPGGWPSDEPAGERLRFACLLTAAFLLLTVPRLLLHELWRDEAWVWLVVTGSRSLHELFAALSRSGEGYLFPLLCYLARQ